MNMEGLCMAVVHHAMDFSAWVDTRGLALTSWDSFGLIWTKNELWGVTLFTTGLAWKLGIHYYTDGIKYRPLIWCLNNTKICLKKSLKCYKEKELYNPALTPHVSSLPAISLLRSHGFYSCNQHLFLYWEAALLFAKAFLNYYSKYTHTNH